MFDWVLKTPLKFTWEWTILWITITAQKMTFSIKDFFGKWEQIRSFLRICSHLIKKSLMENVIFCAVNGYLILISDNCLFCHNLLTREIYYAINTWNTPITLIIFKCNGFGKRRWKCFFDFHETILSFLIITWIFFPASWNSQTWRTPLSLGNQCGL